MTISRDKIRRQWPSTLTATVPGPGLRPGRCLHSLQPWSGPARSMVMRISARRSAIIARR